MPKLWEEVPAISDPDCRLYAGVGLAKATVAQLLRPRTVVQSFRALFKGHGVGRPRGGDVRQMPGAFLYVDGAIVWSCLFEDGAGERPDWAGLYARAAAGAQS